MSRKKSWLRISDILHSNSVSMVCRLKMSYTFTRWQLSWRANHVTVCSLGCLRKISLIL